MTSMLRAVLRRLGQAITFARQAPALAKAVALGITLTAGAIAWHTRTVEHAVTAAVAADRVLRAQAAAQVLSTVVKEERAKAAWAVAAAEERTRAAWASRDSAVLRTRRLEAKLDASLKQWDVAIRVLPDSLRDLPAVTQVVGACTALANDCEALRARIVEERAATETAQAETNRERSARIEQQRVADSALTQAGIIMAEQGDRIVRAERRPTKTQLVMSSIGSALIGAIVGALR